MKLLGGSKACHFDLFAFMGFNLPNLGHHILPNLYIYTYAYIYTYGYHQRNIYIDIEKQPLVDHFTPVPMDSHVIFLKLIWDQLGMGMIIGRSSQT